MFKKLFRRLFARNTLYYPGCLIKSVATDLDKNYRLVLKKLGVEFLVIDDFVCCGSPVINAGYVNDFKKLREKNLALLDRFGIGKIITPCPACFKILSQEYKLPDKGITVTHVTQLLTGKKFIKKFEKKGKKAFGFGEAAYHDPCHLGRHCQVYEEPRKLLTALGVKLVEFSLNRETAFCCGAGAGVKANFPEEAEKIARLRLRQARTKTVVTCCPLCYLHMKESEKRERKVVREISQLLKDAL